MKGIRDDLITYYILKVLTLQNSDIMIFYNI